MKKGTGGNLMQPTRRFLFNTVTVKDFGMFTDLVTGFKNLIFKKLGYSLANIGLGANITITKQCTDAGQLKVVSVDFDDACPCTECGFDYGINVAIRHMTPGYFNDFAEQQQKPYAGEIANINCVSGAIDSTQIDTMKDDIINQINADLGFMNEFSGANVIAGRAIHLTAWDAASAITINGTAYGAQATIAAFVAAINAGTDAYAFLDPTTPATELWVIANTTPTTLTVVNTAGTITVPTKYTIGIISKDVKWTFEVEIQHLDATGTVTEIQASKFPFLTSDDVFRLFPSSSAAGSVKHNGSLGIHEYIQQPEDGAEYCKIIIAVTDDINSLDGASHFEHYVGTVELYVKKTQLTGDKWDAANPMLESGFVANTEFYNGTDGLLDLWKL